MSAPTIGDLRVWWIPQIPMLPFYVPVKSVEEAAKLVEILASYDAFQFEHRIKPDYSNVGGLQVYEDEDGDGSLGWCDWCDPETGEDFNEVRRPFPEAWAWQVKP